MSQFQGFLNKVCFVIYMHPNRHNTSWVSWNISDRNQMAWFASLLKKKSRVLKNFDTFINEFQASFGDMDNVSVENQTQVPVTGFC